MTTASWKSRAGTALLGLALVLGGCSDEIVYRDLPDFVDPPQGAEGFLGFSDVEGKRTTCGNCHSGKQAQWEGTAHSHAWETLANSGASTKLCENCHTVSSLGNLSTGPNAGYVATQSPRYQDVQCESCHGPGLNHVTNPDVQANKPLASLAVGAGLTNGCGECHSGAHQPFAEEWAASGHANVSASRASNAECAGCHDGRKALERFDTDVNYKEKTGATEFQPTTCAVCHNPHGSSNPSQLRFPVTSQDPAQNLCMQCHLRRVEPLVTSSSPHAPQGAVLLGSAGYRPPSFTYDTARIFGSHATEKNPKLCAGCHVGKFTVTDKLTGAFSFQATGHLMRPIPCLDATGKPTADKTCAYTTAARSWQTCAASGCHANAAAANNAFNTVRARMKFLADQLWLNSNNDGSLQASPTDGGLLATLKATRPTEWSTTDNRVTPAEGAEFNARLCGEYNQSNSDNSKGIHNPFLCEALLIATIDYTRSFYNMPAATADVAAAIRGPIGGEFAGAMRIARTPPGK
jgi:predicted CXXCH cytochrome family protein